MFCCKGEKSDDPQSPAYIPSLFDELKPQEERLANQKLKRYEAVKRREQQRDCLLTSTAEHTEILTANSQPISNNMDSEQEVPATFTSVATQTVFDEDKCESKIDAPRPTTKYPLGQGYPDREMLEKDDNLVAHYTGLPDYAISQVR